MNTATAPALDRAVEDLLRAAATELMRRYPLTLVRCWAASPATQHGVVVAASASAKADGVYGGLIPAAVGVAVRSTRATFELASPDANDGRFTRPRAAAKFLGVPVRDSGATIAYVEAYGGDQLTFDVASDIERGLSPLGPALAAAGATASLASPARGKIVIAEDDAVTRAVLRRVLTHEDFTVVDVADGRAAVEAVRRELPDLVVLDWLMPEMDGHQVTVALKADQATRDIPVVMLTGHAQIDAKVAALESGVADFLTKPFQPADLIARIGEQLRWRKLLRDPSSGNVAAPAAPLAAAGVEPQRAAPSHGALRLALADAEAAEHRGDVGGAAAAYKRAAEAAAASANAPLEKKLMRLAGKAFLGSAERAADASAVQTAYIEAARAFLAVGNLGEARRSIDGATASGFIDERL